MKATCQKCGHKGLEAVFVGIQKSIAIEGLDGDGLLLYGKEMTTGGTLEGVRCPACGEAVKGDGGGPIRSIGELAACLANDAGSGHH